MTWLAVIEGVVIVGLVWWIWKLNQHIDALIELEVAQNAPIPSLAVPETEDDGGRL